MSDNEIPQNKSLGDFANITAKAFLASIPVVGNFAAEYFGLLITPPMEKRREQFFQELANDLARLEEQVGAFNMQKLFTDEQFLSSFLQASRLAAVNHNQENLQALRNALLNSALPKSPDEIRQKIFIEWAGEMTTWHIKILRLFADQTVHIPDLHLDNPEWRLDGNGINRLAEIIEARYSETEGNYDLYLQIVSDLHARGLLTHTRPARHSLARISESPILSRGAEEFLSFITSPIQD